MSTAVAQLRPRIVLAGRQAEPRSLRVWRLPALSIFAFATLALLAGQRFEALIAHPSFFRVAGVVAVAGGLAAGLLASAALPASGSVTLLRAIGAVLALYLSIRIAGVAPTRLLPWHWGSLVRGLSRGTSHLDGRWPYRGSSLQTRIVIQACVPAAVLPAAALVFWPGRAGASRRRLAALALLLTLYVTAAANEPRTGWQVQGLIALLALYLWAWSSRTRRAEDGRATGWLLTGAVLSLPLATALTAKPLIDVKSWQPFGERGATTSFNWNQTYGPLPWSTSTATMAEVGSRSPHLWRAVVLDRFDGTRFLASGRPPLEPSGAPTEPGNRRWITTSTFTVRALAGHELLSPGQILAAKVEGSVPVQLQTPAPDGTVRADKMLPSGARYTVTAYIPHPTVREMREAHSIRSDGLRPYISFELPATGTGTPRPASSYTTTGRARIEASPYAPVYRLARRLEAGRTDAYDVATHIQSFLRTRFTYDTQTPRTRYPIVAFLLRERRGYCQQFSAAMTLMLRMDGIPARVASGFLPGSRDSGKSAFTLRGPDAHAWVEVFFTGIGWVPFDPTPSQTLSIPKGGGGSELSAGQLAAASKAKPGRPKAGLTPRSAGRTPSGGGSEWWRLAGGGGILAVAAFGLWRARAAHRRARWDGGEGAIEELVRALSRLGLAPAPGTTLSELEHRLAGSHGAEASSYLRALRTLRYAPSSTAPPPSAKERRRLRQALTAGRGPLSRIRALRALPPRIRLD